MDSGGQFISCINEYLAMDSGGSAVNEYLAMDSGDR